jgi:hypothetical protein
MVLYCNICTYELIVTNNIAKCTANTMQIHKLVNIYITRLKTDLNGSGNCSDLSALTLITVDCQTSLITSRAEDYCQLILT